MPTLAPIRPNASRKASNQRFAWLAVLLAAIGMAALVHYVETRKPATLTSTPAPTPATKPASPAAPTPPGLPITPPTPQVDTPKPPTASAGKTPKPPTPKPPPKAKAEPENASHATTPRTYRQDAARHLYARNAARIYKGKLQPLLYAVGVLQVHLDQNGKIKKLYWMRAPKHAPEVIREIERTVRAAAPYPAPVRMGGVVYTDTWLWDKSGKFQLDTLTEGQL